jgi:hypothetical protein
MIEWLDHVEGCDRCKRTPKFPCPVGYDLFQRTAERLARRYDPNRAKA